MDVGSYIYQCDNHPRQADSIKVFVLCENGKYVLTFFFFVFFPLALCMVHLCFHLAHGALSLM